MSLSPFGSIPVGKKGRTNFDLSHSLSGTFGLGYCQPVFMTQDVIPGDRFSIRVHNLTKLETLIVPAMQQVDASLLWFKLPKRLCYKNFKDWYSGGVDGNTDADKPHFNIVKIIEHVQQAIYPITATMTEADKRNLTAQLFGPGTLWNYFGLPCPLDYDNGTWKIKQFTDIDVSEFSEDDSWIDAIPFIAYWLIHDEYFMDQTLGNRMFVSEGDLQMNADYERKIVYKSGGTTGTFSSSQKVGNGGELSVTTFMVLNQLFKRAWRKDYFTSALPTPQRGPEVKIGITEDSVPVEQVQDIYLQDNEGLITGQTNVQVGTDSRYDKPIPLDIKVKGFIR